jgi:hypothetical protein
MRSTKTASRGRRRRFSAVAVRIAERGYVEQAADAALGGLRERRSHSSDIPGPKGQPLFASFKMSMSRTSSPTLRLRRSICSSLAASSFLGRALKGRSRQLRRTARTSARSRRS